MMRVFGSLTVRLVVSPWGKVIWALNFVSNPFPAGELGILVGTGIHESPRTLPAGMFRVGRTAGQFECQWLRLLWPCAW
jgi:hypothetical protein